ncbi:MAG: S8 family serine peptidase, partial [Armatimonadota bacterium]
MSAECWGSRRVIDTSQTQSHCKLRAAAGWIARGGLVIVTAVLMMALGPTDALAQRTQSREVLVGMRSTVQSAQAAMKIQRQTGAHVRKSLARGRILVVETPASETQMSFKSKLLRDPAVAFVEPNGMMYPAVTPDDPEYSEQYHLPLIRAPEAWEVTTGSREIVIAVVDTGVDTDHPDLEQNIFVNTGEIPDNGVDDDENGFVDDVNGWD